MNVYSERLRQGDDLSGALDRIAREQTIGGHLSEGCIVRLRCELVIGVFSAVVYTRELDPGTGFDELRIRPAQPR